jgi:ribosomal protein S18 acetylase RimI-like enzyme
MMLVMRKATLLDLDFLERIDLADEGITSDLPIYSTAQELADHRERIIGFVNQTNDVAWVYEDQRASQLVGTIMYRFRDRYHEERSEANEFLFRFIGDSWLPPDGRFCEVYNLWIDPLFRRQGLASRLKQHMEAEARCRDIKVIYTHTEERNKHVIAMNEKLGYHVIRRGPIWDSVIRVSLIKMLV